MFVADRSATVEGERRELQPLGGLAYCGVNRLIARGALSATNRCAGVSVGHLTVVGLAQAVRRNLDRGSVDPAVLILVILRVGHRLRPTLDRRPDQIAPLGP